MDEMLEAMPSEKFDELIAMDHIVPFGDEKICWVLALGFAALMDRIAAVAGNKDVKPVDPKAFIPWLKKKKKRQYINPNAMAAAFKMAVNRG